jgi:hypothetical protein
VRPVAGERDPQAPGKLDAGVVARRGRWVVGALAAVAGIALAASDAVWHAVGYSGLLIGLPQGVLPALLLVPLLLFALGFSGRAVLAVGPRLLHALGLHRLSETRGRAALWSVAGVLLALGIASTIALAPDWSRPDRRPLCTSERLVLDAGRVAGRLMGHGRVAAAADCRGVGRPPLGPLLPALLACAVVLSLLAAHDRHWQRENDRRDALRRAAFVRAAADAGAAPAHAAQPPTERPADANADAQAARPPPALSPRSAALMARRRASAEAPGTDWLAPARRWPVLATGLITYAAGWALTLAGSDLAERLAEHLAPAALWQTQPGWAVPGLWLSACVAGGAGLALWLRRRGED